MSIALSSVAVFADAVRGARDVELSAYTLRAGSVRAALVTAAESGAAVRVRLERDPLDDAARTLHRANAESVARLAAAGADAALTVPGEPVLHMKAAIVDGEAWLDDRNWAGDGRETVVRDTDPADVAALEAALRGDSRPEGPLRTTKAGAQQLEAALIRAAGAGPLAVESESFGNGPVYSALLARGRAGLPAQLLVAGREAAASGPAGERERRRLATLAELGVDVRTGTRDGVDFDEKLALTEGAAWIGSANATYARGAAGDQRDWGLVTRAPDLVAGVRAAYIANWNQARPFVAAAAERPDSAAAAGARERAAEPAAQPSPLANGPLTPTLR